MGSRGLSHMQGFKKNSNTNYWYQRRTFTVCWWQLQGQLWWDHINLVFPKQTFLINTFSTLFTSLIIFYLVLLFFYTLFNYYLLIPYPVAIINFCLINIWSYTYNIIHVLFCGMSQASNFGKLNVILDHPPLIDIHVTSTLSLNRWGLNSFT